MPYASYPQHFPGSWVSAAVDGWFEAMAALYRTSPRDGNPDARYPLYVTLGSQDIRDAVLHPLGAGGRHGFALLNGPDDHEAWLAREAARSATEDVPEFPRLELTFGSLADAQPEVRDELVRHERALGDAVPSVWSFDNTGQSRPGDVDDLMILEAVAAAVAEALAASPAGGIQAAAVQTIEPEVHTVPSGGGELEVELSTRPIRPEAGLPASSLLDALSALDDEDGWLAESRERYAIEYRLSRRFMRSTEASSLAGDCRYWQTMAQYAASHVGHTVASLDADGLDEIVFDIVPRKISADVDYARPFIECLRAFYHWLDREYALPQALACVARLDAPESVERLEALMADSANFDPAKAMVMEAIAMGIDPTTPEGAQQMHEAMNARLSDASSAQYARDPFHYESRTAPVLDPETRRKRTAKRKAGRKAARKARKRNRR